MQTNMTLEPGSQRGPSSAVHGRSLTGTTVIVPMLNTGAASEIIQLAGTLAVGPHPGYTPDGIPAYSEPRVVVVSVVEVPPDQPLTTGLVLARSYRALLDFLPSEVEVAGGRVRVDRIVKVARDVASAVNEAAADERAGLVLLHWKGYARQPRRHTYGRTIDSILKSPPCDVALVRPDGWHQSRRVLLAVRGGPAAERALTLALGLAEHLGLPVSVIHNVPSGQAKTADTMVEARGEEPYIVFNEHLKAAEKTTGASIERVLTVGGDLVTGLLAEVRQRDLLVMGAAAPEAEKGLEPPPVSPVALRVSEAKGPPILLLYTPEPLNLAGYKHRVQHGHRSKKAWNDMPFEHWFVENTYHGDEFKDPDAFMEAKERSGLSISVAMLTSNDAPHIYSWLTGLKRVLEEMHPIADQIAIIDAGSHDDTRDIARSLGTEVYSCAELLADKGSLHGRGESWWKSLSVLKGDIIVWLDPRAQRFHPSTAMSLAGPLLRVPTFQYVKAYGQPHPDKAANGKHHTRAPHTNGNGGSDDYAPVDMSWGGFVMPHIGADEPLSHIRVQALRPQDLRALDSSQLADLPLRTILQVLCPSLAAVIEPFSRDMAGRRSAMLNLPAFIGNNLEVGLLLSVAAEYGTRAIAQVELRHAQPAPPPHPGLRNTIDLLQALAHRLQDPAMRRLAAECAQRIEKSIEGHGTRAIEDAGGPVFEVRELGPVERPPMMPVLGQ